METLTSDLLHALIHVSAPAHTNTHKMHINTPNTYTIKALKMKYFSVPEHKP